ncbi:MAG: MFS transporter [Erysipelotrichaceae bacterium]|nr:MFS transporter [Erysipelotrichaceae bacterium]
MKDKTRIWLALLLFGLLGQLAWTIENMYFNVFVYNTLSGSVSTIAAMVAASAVTATLTTLFMGALSDRTGKRKIFICLGYLIWGLSVIAFAFLNLENVARLFPAAAVVSTAGLLAIIMDCVMTFFGSTANDACFNAWVTDSVSPKERGKYETVLATLPLASMLIVFGLLDSLTQQGKWDLFFIIIGSLVSVGGLLGVFIIRDSPTIRRNSNSFLSNLVSGFRPEVIRENKALYLSLLCLLVFSISTQIFMPYMIIYIQRCLGINDYAVILGVVLLTASVISILAGRVIDIAGADLFFIPSVVLLVAGLILMYTARSSIGVILAGIVMMSGNLIVTALINGSIRDNTPRESAGGFQGIRMIFGVMLPMIIGPYIGAAVINNANETYEDLGVIKQVPTPAIWLAAAIVAALLIIPWFLLKKQKKADSQKHYNLLTKYGEQLKEDSVLPEYPRPQFKRDSYINLNGLWHYAITADEEMPEAFNGEVLVPFPIESVLSRVNKTITPKDVLWYRRSFTLPADFNRGIVRLNFGAVDQICRVYVNGKLAGEHEGGYLPFSVDITPYLKPENELTVCVRDYTDTRYYARGKQSSSRGGIWYTPTSGIWQTVWLESFPKQHIDGIRIDIDYDSQLLKLQVNGTAKEYEVTVKEGRRAVVSESGKGPFSLSIPDMHSWSPEDPFLYDLTIRCQGDSVDSYFAMRKFSVGCDKAGKNRLMLNNQPYFHRGVLDQGYYSDGIYTPADYRQIEDDILMLKEMGFNTIRKHIKIEPLMFYHYCDKLGMLVWQDMVSGGGRYSFLVTAALPFIGKTLKDSHYGLFARKSEASRQCYRQEMRETVEHLCNVPSLALWVPFNEGWGQFDARENEKLLRQLDSSRIIDHASGWHDQKGGDLLSKHIYFNKISFEPDNRVWALTEYGGYNWMIPGHVYNNSNYGYKGFSNQTDLQAAFLLLHSEQIIPLISEGLSAVIYTQLSDVEDEVNGLVTYDRRVIKFDPKVVRSVMNRLTL